MNDNEILLREMDAKIDSMTALVNERLCHILELLEAKPEIRSAPASVTAHSKVDGRMSAAPIRLPGDVWGCRVNRPKPEPGTTVTIVSRAGKAWTGVLKEKVRGDLLTSDWTYESVGRPSGSPSIEPLRSSFNSVGAVWPEEGSGFGPPGETEYPGSDKDDSDSIPF